MRSRRCVACYVTGSSCVLVYVVCAMTLSEAVGQPRGGQRPRDSTPVSCRGHSCVPVDSECDSSKTYVCLSLVASSTCSDIRNRLHFRPAIVAWSILSSDRWYFYFCAVTVNWLILFNRERRVELRIPRSSLFFLRPTVHI